MTDRKRSTGKRLIGLLVLVSLLTVGCANTAATLPDQSTERPVAADDAKVDEIRQRGYLMVGVKTDVPDLSYYDKKHDTWSGLEIELAYKTAACLFDVTPEEAREQNLVEFVGVTVEDREDRLEAGDFDVMLATYSVTDARKERFVFSNVYYKDHIGLMVRKEIRDANSLGKKGIHSVLDLDGKYVGVPRSATTREEFLQYISSMNSLTVSPIFCEFEGYDQLFQALQNGNIDAIAVDVAILKGYVDNSTTILSERFSTQEYAAAVTKQNQALIDYVNRAIVNDYKKE